jgi:hypothetical protein
MHRTHNLFTLLMLKSPSFIHMRCIDVSNVRFVHYTEFECGLNTGIQVSPGQPRWFLFEAITVDLYTSARKAWLLMFLNPALQILAHMSTSCLLHLPPSLITRIHVPHSTFTYVPTQCAASYASTQRSPLIVQHPSNWKYEGN